MEPESSKTTWLYEELNHEFNAIGSNSGKAAIHERILGKGDGKTVSTCRTAKFLFCRGTGPGCAKLGSIRPLYWGLEAGGGVGGEEAVRQCQFQARHVQPLPDRFEQTAIKGPPDAPLAAADVRDGAPERRRINSLLEPAEIYCCWPGDIGIAG